MRDLYKFNEEFSDYIESEYNKFVEFILLYYKWQTSKGVISNHNKNTSLDLGGYIERYKTDLLNKFFPTISDSELDVILLRISSHISNSHNSPDNIKFISRLTSNEITKLTNSVNEILIFSNGQSFDRKILTFTVDSIEISNFITDNITSGTLGDWEIHNIVKIDTFKFSAIVSVHGELFIGLLNGSIPISPDLYFLNATILDGGNQYIVGDVIKTNSFDIGVVEKVTSGAIDSVEILSEVVPVVAETFVTSDINISGFVESIGPLVIKLTHQNFDVSESYFVSLSDGTELRLFGSDIGKIEEISITKRLKYFAGNETIDSQFGNGVDFSLTSDIFWQETSTVQSKIISGEIYNSFSYTVNNFIIKKMFELSGIRVIQDISTTFFDNCISITSQNNSAEIDNIYSHVVPHLDFLNVQYNTLLTNTLFGFGFEGQSLNFDEYFSGFGIDNTVILLTNVILSPVILSEFGQQVTTNLFITTEFQPINNFVGSDSDVEVISGDELPIISIGVGQTNEGDITTIQSMDMLSESGIEPSYDFDWAILDTINSEFGTEGETDTSLNIQISEIISEIGMNLLANIQADDIGQIDFELGSDSNFEV